MSKANEYMVGGTHYVEMGSVQPWDAMQCWMSSEAFAGFLRGNAIKYLARCDKKGGVSKAALDAGLKDRRHLKLAGAAAGRAAVRVA